MELSIDFLLIAHLEQFARNEAKRVSVLDPAGVIFGSVRARLPGIDQVDKGHL